MKVIFSKWLTDTSKVVERASFTAFWRHEEEEISGTEIPDMVKWTKLELSADSDGTRDGFEVATVGIEVGTTRGVHVGELEGRRVVGADVGADDGRLVGNVVVGDIVG